MSAAKPPEPVAALDVVADEKSAVFVAAKSALLFEGIQCLLFRKQPAHSKQYFVASLREHVLSQGDFASTAVAVVTIADAGMLDLSEDSDFVAKIHRTVWQVAAAEQYVGEVAVAVVAPVAA